MEFDELSNHVIRCAIEVHRHLGAGLLESAYEQCLSHELRRRTNGRLRGAFPSGWGRKMAVTTPIPERFPCRSAKEIAVRIGLLK